MKDWDAVEAELAVSVVTVDGDEVVCDVVVEVAPADTDREIADSALNVAAVSGLTVKVTITTFGLNLRTYC